jgi:dihydroorotase
MVVLPAGLVPTDIGVRDGRIVEIGSIATGQGGQEIDATGLTVLPGMIDTQVHFREPGGEHKEDLATGSEAAVMGGITGVFEMPNTNPSTSTPEAVNDKLTRAKGRMWCEHAFYVGATPDNIKDLPELERMPGTASKCWPMAHAVLQCMPRMKPACVSASIWRMRRPIPQLTRTGAIQLLP